MAQYTVFPDDGTYLEIEGLSGRKFRFSYDYPGTLNLKQTITSTGFAGVEGTDYDIIENYELPVDPGAGYRLGVRSGYWNIDQVYTPVILGFTGSEGIDWDTIEKHQLP